MLLKDEIVNTIQNQIAQSPVLRRKSTIRGKKKKTVRVQEKNGPENNTPPLWTEDLQFQPDQEFE